MASVCTILESVLRYLRTTTNPPPQPLKGSSMNNNNGLPTIAFLDETVHWTEEMVDPLSDRLNDTVTFLTEYNRVGAVADPAIPRTFEVKQLKNKTKEGYNDFLQAKQRGRRK